jgi:predicted transcriptional regulator
LTSALLSIRPEFADAILAGRKQVEFRRRGFSRTVREVFLYSTGSRGAVVGRFAVAIVNRLTPQQAWRRYRRVAGISRKGFFAYFAGARHAVCIEVTNVSRPSQPLPRSRLWRGFSVPQSFAYLTPPQIRKLKRARWVPRGKGPRR